MAKKKKYYQRPDGLFEVSRTIHGKRIMFRGKTCREVDQKILNYQEKEEAGRLFPAVADEWERQHEKKIAEASRRNYSYSVKRLKAAFPGPIKEITPMDVNCYIRGFEDQGYAGNTVAIELSVCKQIFSHAVQHGDIAISPAVQISKSKGLPFHPRNALTEEQEKIVKRSGVERTAPGWLFPYFLFYTGMRRGEALAITHHDIDRKAGVIHVTKKISYARGDIPFLEDHLKSKSGRRKVPLLPPLAEALPQKGEGLLFPNARGGYWSSTETTKVWRAYCRAVKLNDLRITDEDKIVETFPVTPHCFRHSFATLCYEAGLDSRQTAQILGDTPETVEKIYTHLRETHAQSGVEQLMNYCKTAV